MGKNKKELDEMLSSDSECEKIKEKKVKKKKAKNVDEEEDNEGEKVIDINEKPSEKEKKKKKNKERKCSETKEEVEDEIKESKKKKNKKDKVKKENESSDDDESDDKVVVKKKDKKKTPVKVDDDDDESDDEKVVVKKKKQKKVERKSSSSSEDIVIEKTKKTSKTKIEEANDKDDDNDDDNSDEEEVKPKVKKTQPKKESKKADDEDDDENEDEEEDKEEVKEKPKPKPKDNTKDTQNEEAPQKHLQQKSYSSGTWPELFIKNLSYTTTDVGLADFFSKYGDVEETKVVYDKQSGRSKGVGFCRFYDASSAVKAMEDAGKLSLDGRPIAISYSNERPSSTNTQPKFKADTSYQGARYGLFVGNLSFKSNEQGIKNLFEDCGKIIDIRIAKNEQGKMRGFAHVDFDSSESVDKALKKNGFKLDGRELKLDKSESKPARGGNSSNSNVGQGKGRNNVKVDDVTKAKKSGAIIAPKENKVIQFDNSDDDDEE